jgi:hypothetical protein
MPADRTTEQAAEQTIQTVDEKACHHPAADHPFEAYMADPRPLDAHPARVAHLPDETTCHHPKIRVKTRRLKILGQLYPQAGDDLTHPREAQTTVLQPQAYPDALRVAYPSPAQS